MTARGNDTEGKRYSLGGDLEAEDSPGRDPGMNGHIQILADGLVG